MDEKPEFTPEEYVAKSLAGSTEKELVSEINMGPMNY